jgi:spermidine synthase
MLHPSPARVVIIGLGSGDTAYSAAGRPETETLDCLEIIGGQIQTLRELHGRTGYPGLIGLLTDPRIRVITGDGRRYVMQSRQRFDVIEADALRPSSAYSGNLYSREYFELLRDRLEPGGFAVTWAPTPRIKHTFAEVFAHVAEIPPMLIGSNTAIAFDADAIRARANHPQTAEHYRRAGIDLEMHLDQMIASFRQSTRPAEPATDGMLNTDLFPRDELRAR